MPIDALLKSPQVKTALTGFLGGAAGGALAGSLTRKKSAKKMLKAGGLVAIGGIALKAYQQYQQGSGGRQAPRNLLRQVGMEQHHEVAPASIAVQEQDFSVEPDDALLLLKSMVAAAHADGHISEVEQVTIWRHAASSGLAPEALHELESLLADPPGLTEIAGQARDLSTKMEVYAAAQLVVDDECSNGQSYLAMLARSLQLPTSLVSALNSEQSGVGH